MQMKKRVNNSIKTLIITNNDVEFLVLKSQLNNELYEVLDISTDIFTLNFNLEHNLPDLIIGDIQQLEKSMIETLVHGRFLEIPILFISGTIEDKILDLVNTHPKSLFLTKPLHELTLKSSLNLLANAYPPRSRNYIEVINRNHQVLKIRFEEIVFIEAEGNYTFINTINHKVYARKKSLKKLRNELADNFIQINKSHVINVTFIKRIELGRGIMFVEGKEIKIGRAFRRELNQFLKKS
jgi:DNA-binding LytR/AlgR family response regulator